MVNSGNLCEVIVQTPGNQVCYEGDVAIDGVPGTSAPIVCNYLETAGSATGALLPTGNIKDEIDGTEVTCIDNGMPVVVIRAEDLGISGRETRDELNTNENLKARLEQIRLKAGPMMNLGDVTDKVIPKMSLISAPQIGGCVNSRTFIPHVCHAAVGVLGAVSIATACILDGSVTNGIAVTAPGDQKQCSIEHPTGEFSVNLETEVIAGELNVKRSGLLRTARLLSRGDVYVQV
jgi:4-oxalomesaconate tautomerase